ncbi:PKD domain-containing protein [bacterium]|nr:PKD domain-containing protein [bacterium]
MGCNWFALGLLNIFDPQAQIRVNYTEINIGTGIITLEVYSLNRVEFIGEGFSYDYYIGTTLIDGLSKTVGATFYVEPSDTPGMPGPITTIDNLPIYFKEVQDYLTANPLITEITCTINLIGTDGAGHDISIPVTFGLPALQPGIDFYPPTAVINVLPDTTGTAPFTVVFNASESYDNEPGDASTRIESYAWDFGDETTGTNIIENHTYDNSGLYFVTLTVTDFYGNTGCDTVIITVNEPEAPIAKINTTPAEDENGIVTGAAPFTVYFDAYESESEAEIISYTWDFGDGTTSTGITKSHTYSNIGTYTVILTVTDSNGKKGYNSVKIKVEKAPTAVINTTPPEVDGIVTVTAPSLTVYFDAYESTSESGIVSYIWDFGDGSTGTDITTSHTYSSSGVDYTAIVILTITDANGYKAYDSVKIKIDCGCPPSP